MLRRRVVVSGLSVVMPQFRSISEFWNALVTGTSAVCQPSPDYNSILTLPAAFAGNIAEFESQDTAQQKVIRKSLKVMSREIQMAVAASCRALNCAGIQIGQFPPERIGISFGSDYIITTAEDVIDGVRSCTTDAGFDFKRWGTDGLSKMQPLWQLKYLPNMPSSHIAILNNFHGPSNSMTLREASVGAVVGESVNIIADGRADIIVAGTTGSRLHPFKMLHALQQEELSKTGCRPFDLNRDGTILGEGAGSVILEEREHAEKRGATIWAEIVCSSYRFNSISGVVESVLRQSGFTPDDVGHINAHGLGSKASDKKEADAINSIFGQRKTPIPVAAAKGIFGNLGAGAGMIELIAGILALKNNVLYPSANYATPDPACPLALTTDAKTPPGNSFIKIAFNPQGQASAVLVRQS